MAIDLAHGRRLIAAAAAAGFVLRLAFGLGYWVGKPMTHDEREYLALARSLSAGQGFVYDVAHETGTAQQVGRAPAYPLFLTIVGAGTRDYSSVPARVKIAQSLLGALSVWIMALMAMRAVGPGAGIAAAAIAAVYPPLVAISAYALSETLYSTLALATALLLDMAIERADHANSGRVGAALALAAGLLAGVAILVRPAMLFFLPLAVIWLMLRRRTVLAVALVLAALAVVAPWTARNLRVYDRFVLVASEGGVTFWTGNHPLARGEGDLAANPDIKRAELEFRRAHPDLSAEQLEPLYYRDAAQHILNHPGWWLWLLARKAFYTVVPIGPSYTLHSTKYIAASVVPYLLLLPMAAAGARVLGRSHRRPAALFLLAASSVVVCIAFFPQERFRIPVIDPTIIVCAAAGCAGRLKNR
jgi:4-amino-4-deoxy-L-arabinose transferase-like glycosyltransferase